MSEWWGIRREQDLKKIRKSTIEFISNLESQINEFENNPNELASQLKKVIGQFKKEIEG